MKPFKTYRNWKSWSCFSSELQPPKHPIFDSAGLEWSISHKYDSSAFFDFGSHSASSLA